MHLFRRPEPRILGLAAAGLLLMASARAATPGTPARLLVAEKDGRAIFLLPESHIGTPAQQDAYFRETIRPAFAAASALLLERSLSARLSPDYYERRCDVEGPDEPALDADVNAALRAHPDPVLAHVLPLEGDLERLGRFIRFEMLLQAWIGRGHVQPADDAAHAVPAVRVLPAQSGQLMMATPHPYRSVDDTASFFQAYCALAPAERSVLVRRLLDDLDAAVQPQAGAEQDLAGMYRTIDATYQACLAAIRAALTHPHGAAADVRHWTPTELITQRFLIAERNRGWIAQLPSVLASERLPFYAIGAAHFVDGPYGAGLITLLREAGYRVSLVPDRPALRAVLARVPADAGKADAPAPGPGLLAGKCIRIPGNYSCAWRDATTLYQATLPSPSSPEELLTVCYRRRAADGPLDQCVTARVPRAPQRAADLGP
jgi:hypothetical protein